MPVEPVSDAPAPSIDADTLTRLLSASAPEAVNVNDAELEAVAILVPLTGDAIETVGAWLAVTVTMTCPLSPGEADPVTLA